ncbi:MAG: glycosyltransferase [Bacteroidetes bacterium CG2_30_32_10]|nr:MAG: glycosyltransferase [Bacteroidetes bacterium CG2_30_32_10]
MDHSQQYWDLFNTKKCCVIIPTYNNCMTLSNVIEEVSYYTNNVIVVNDGSTDNTENILNKFSTITVLSIKQNTGKGNALKKGFEIARDKGYEYAISIDSDGQHFAEDLPKFIEIIEQEPEAIVLGARNMTQEGIPGKSSFGNKFSNFWFRIETGIKHPDTQSGYRLYPIKLLEKMHFFTKKFEFEIEVIVRAAWNGVKVVFIPIKIYYSPKEKRISHFRPFRDFARISVLNTCLVLIALIYARPFNFIKKLNKKNVKYFIKNNLLNPEESNIRKAIAVSFGIFMGILPVWGYQLILAIVLAHVFKLNKFIVIVTANISIPPMIPFVLFASFKTGGIILGSKASHLSFISGITFETVKNNLYQYLIGSLVFGFLLSILCGLLTYLILRFFKRKIAASI